MFGPMSWCDHALLALLAVLLVVGICLACDIINDMLGE